jgi:uncharacterized protein with PQ loop repeat
MSTIATVIGLTAAVCTTAANLPQLKKAWVTGQTDDLSLKTLLLFGSGLVLWIIYGVLQRRRHHVGQRYQPSDFKCDSVFEGSSTAG